jgi:D-alanyl-D-alanine carboxypeptidase (penicillin-binding protein 5/6)
MKKFRRFYLLLLICALLVPLCLPAQAVQAEQTSVNGCKSLDAKFPLKQDEQLLETAKSVILYELDSHTLVYAWNADEQLDPSGMNKIMTALLALEKGDPSAEVTVSRDALDSVPIGSMSANLKRDEKISLLDLLYCMMVGSANDAAAVIAEHISGSQEEFVALMNQRAKELGCTNTNFLNPNGLSMEGQYSTARDLAKITEKALENELFTQLFCTETYTIPATNESEERKVLTTNYMMSKESVKTQFDARVTGGKTGALTTTDRSLIAISQVKNIRYLSVVMGAQGKLLDNGSVERFGSFEETKVLLDHGFGGYEKRELFGSGQSMARFQVGGYDIAVGPATAVSAMLPVEIADSEVSYRTASNKGIAMPIAQGQVMGRMEVWFRSMCVAECDLVALHRLEDAQEVIRPVDPEQMKVSKFPWKTIGLVIAIVSVSLLLLAVLALLAVRLLGSMRSKTRHKNRRKNHQRSRK